MDLDRKADRFSRVSLPRITTGALSLDEQLGGGLPICCITDVFGAAGTGKTQFSFQNVVTTCQYLDDSAVRGIKVVFVDCAGSFRPERIVEIADSRGFKARMVLESTFSVAVRSASAQIAVNRRLNDDPIFSSCRLLIVDDVTSNFVSDYSNESELPARQRDLSLYARQLGYLANKKGFSVLMTNSIRSRGDLGEGETTGEVLSQYCLYRLHFTRLERRRYMQIVQPRLSSEKIPFEIGAAGIS